jgi:hypothetical protein
MLMQPNAKKTKQRTTPRYACKHPRARITTKKQGYTTTTTSLHSPRHILQLTPLPQILRCQPIPALHTLLHPMLRDTHCHRIAALWVLRRLPLAIQQLRLKYLARLGQRQDSAVQQLRAREVEDREFTLGDGVAFFGSDKQEARGVGHCVFRLGRGDGGGSAVSRRLLGGGGGLGCGDGSGARRV